MKKEFIVSIDFIRVIAIIGVVIIHTFNGVHSRPDFVGGSTWWIANFFESFARTSIPLFVLISGFLMLGKKEKFYLTLKRIFWRILIPLLFWLAIYMYWELGVVNPAAYFERLITGGVYHLYFLIIIIGLYLVSPLLKNYVFTSPRVFQKTLVVSFLVLGAVIVGWQYLIRECYSDSLILWIPFLGYFAAGYYLRNRKKSIYLLLPVFVVGFLVTMYFNFVHLSWLATGIGTMQFEGCISPYFDNYLSPGVMLMSLSLFIYLLNLDYGKVGSFAKRIIHSIARASFGIYLIHLLIVQILENKFGFLVDSYHYPLATFIFGKFLIVFMVSWLLSALFIKVPIVKLVFGEKQ